MRLTTLLLLARLLAIAFAAAGRGQMAIHRDAHPVFSELRHPQFVVAFSKQAVPDDIIGRLVPMRDVNGSRYSCYVPPSDAEQQRQGSGSSGAQAAAEQSLMSQKTPEELLDSLTDWCTYRLEDWWHYEVCYKKHVRQFHKEGSKVVSEYKLGLYDGPASDVNDVRTDYSSISGGVKYVAQQYAGGEPCELTGEPRSAEVRYVCGPEGDTVITSLLEPRSCHYRITIKTPRLCKHPAFREQPRRAGLIRCYPEQSSGSGEAVAAAGAEGGAAAATEAAAVAGQCSAGEGGGTCAAPAAEAAGEGGHRRRGPSERVTASGPPGGTGAGLEGGQEGGEGEEEHPRLLKTLLRQNGLDGGDGDYDDDEDDFEAID